MKQNIIGIQQIGVGIPDVHQAWAYYRKHFGMDIPIFQESAEAKLMTPYTGGIVHSRSAVLAINIKGGSGLEIWQFTSRKTAPPDFTLQLGDYGIMIAKVKAQDVKAAYESMKKNGAHVIGALHRAPDGNDCFYVKDELGAIFQVVQGNDWFRKGEHVTGGICGAVIGVSDIDRSKKFYGDLLGYDAVIYDQTDVFNDFKDIPGGAHRIRRVLLGKSKENTGNFSKLLGSSHIELIQVLDRPARKIFENRFWGDLGFIHLCFDVYNMKELEKNFADHGYPFTVDSSSSFDMGEAAGHFSYIEDPDGTLIEFVETYRIPILKKIGWYLDVSKRDRTKTLPDWMLGTLKFNRVKD
jgi:catechol 2,3-dioxygenase-like lactoylglutathione lyase family enzyme/uncharacterized glyoxalase superfamily protein PhnB